MDALYVYISFNMIQDGHSFPIMIISYNFTDFHVSVGEFDESGWHLNKSANLHHLKGCF